MKIDQPRPRLKAQAQTTTPTNGDATIMDDTVMTMNGLALMGGKTAIQPLMRQSIAPIVPRATIKKRR